MKCPWDKVVKPYAKILPHRKQPHHEESGQLRSVYPRYTCLVILDGDTFRDHLQQDLAGRTAMLILEVNNFSKKQEGFSTLSSPGNNFCGLAQAVIFVYRKRCTTYIETRFWDHH